MYFVVTRHLLAEFVVHEATVAHLVRRVGNQRDGATHQPYLVFACGFAEESLYLPAARLLAHHDLVGLFHAHNGEEFRQHHQLGSLLRGVFNQPARLVQIARNVRAGCHLYGGYFEGVLLCGKAGLCGIWGRHDLRLSDNFNENDYWGEALT